MSWTSKYSGWHSRAKAHPSPNTFSPSRDTLAFAVSRLAQYQSNPSPDHMAAARHVLKYLKGSKHLRLCLRRDDDRGSDLIGYCDSDYAGDVDD